MDNQLAQPPIIPNSTPTPPQPPIFTPPTPRKKSFTWLLIPLLIFLFFFSTYFILQINKYKQQLNQPTPTSTPSPSSSAVLPSPSPSLTADWLTYTNQVQHYSFQYPANWQLNESIATVDVNNKLTLTQDNYIITIYANIQNARGTTKQVPSIPITVAGLNLYKRDIGDNLYQNTGSLEISAGDSNPTFQYQNKNYEINFTYPLAEKGTETYLANLQTFDLLLSTFQFTAQNQSPEPLIDNMEVYQNTALGFMIRYPSGIQVIKELNDQYNRLTSFEGNNLKIEVRLRQDTNNTPLDQYYFMDAPISGQTTLGGLNANIYKFPNGYCDGSSCSQPFVAIVTKRNSDFFSLIFSGDVELSEAEKAIISTVQFNIGI
ncbi:MAG: hypothetical protein U0946_03260 [Patescibacteria group bacterium]|nr:hypothetical protein [Patescibacteria group bacterium]